MNELIFFATTFVFLALIIAIYKIFGKTGVHVYTVFSTLICNIGSLKCVDIFGCPITPGIIFYASTYLATDILSENHGKKEAKKAVRYSFAIMMIWMLATQAVLLFKPNKGDVFGPHLDAILGFSPRLFIASSAAFLLSQTFDVFMYHFIWGKTGNNKTKLYLRNNVATILSQAIDTATVIIVGFFGVYTTQTLIGVMISSFLFKSLIALLDTPFLYIARMLKTNVIKAGVLHTG